MRSRQLSFALPPAVALGAEDFFVSDANADAYRFVTETEWPDGKLVLIGPRACGKSHLARVWAAGTGARILIAREITGGAPIRPEARARVVVEDVDTLPRGGEEALFHLHNQIIAAQGALLLTARRAPARWDIALPDLASRMQATTPVRINAPDADLLRAVLLKQFADRQLHPAPRVIDYINARIDRTYAAVADLVEALDVIALSQKSPITMALARQLLAPDQPPEDGADGGSREPDEAGPELDKPGA